MEKESLFIRVVFRLRVIGETMYLMDKEKRYEVIGVNIKDNMLQEKKMVLENMNGVMDQHTRASGKIIILRERGFILAIIKENIPGNGGKMQCMDKESISGQMEGHMKGSFIIIKGMVTEFTIGFLEKVMKEVGNSVNSMVMVKLYFLMGNFKQVSGKMVRKQRFINESIKLKKFLFKLKINNLNKQKITNGKQIYFIFFQLHRTENYSCTAILTC